MSMASRVLVIGAAGGVGQEVAKQLLAQGHVVTATVMDAREEDSLRTVAPGIISVLRLDLSNADSVLSSLPQHITALDAVAVCAAMGPVGPLETTPLALLRKTF